MRSPSSSSSRGPAQGRATERRLAAIWSELLELAEVDVHDDFFDLGGHSLVATQLVARVRESFGLELPIHTVFTRPTIAALATELDALATQTAAEPDARASASELIRPRSSDTDRLPLSLAQVARRDGPAPAVTLDSVRRVLAGVRRSLSHRAYPASRLCIGEATRDLRRGVVDWGTALMVECAHARLSGWVRDWSPQGRELGAIANALRVRVLADRGLSLDIGAGTYRIAP